MAAVELGEILGISKDQEGWKEKDETHVKADMGQMLLDPEVGPSDGMTYEFGLVTKYGLERWEDPAPFWDITHHPARTQEAAREAICSVLGLHHVIHPSPSLDLQETSTTDMARESPSQL
ncbi:hypothetical protein V6N13_117938 [Hibiscus sabdariffa]